MNAGGIQRGKAGGGRLLSRLFPFGLVTCGIGATGFLLALLGGFGRCGPGSPFGLLALLAGLFAVPVSLSFCAIAGVAAAFKHLGGADTRDGPALPSV